MEQVFKENIETNLKGLTQSLGNVIKDGEMCTGERYAELEDSKLYVQNLSEELNDAAERRKNELLLEVLEEVTWNGKNCYSLDLSKFSEEFFSPAAFTKRACFCMGLADAICSVLWFKFKRSLFTESALQWGTFIGEMGKEYHLDEKYHLANILSEALRKSGSHGGLITVEIGYVGNSLRVLFSSSKDYTEIVGHVYFSRNAFSAISFTRPEGTSDETYDELLSKL